MDGAFQPGAGSSPFSEPPAASAEDVAALNRTLKRAMYAPIFSVPNPERQNTPIWAPGSANAMIGVEVNEQLHRLELRSGVPGAAGFSAENRVGDPVASVHIRWMVAPDDFAAGPGRVPPPTPLNPMRSQRFVMLDGQLTFQDRTGTGVRAFGAGRTFPSITPAGPQLQIGAVIDVVEGLGRLRGLPGTIVVNGHIRPPNQLALNLMARFMDISNRLSAREPITPVRSTRSVDPGTLFVAFLGEDDPDRGTQPVFQQGQMLGARVFERLRLVRLEFECSGPRFGGRVREGDLVGRLSAQLHFNAMDPRPVFPIQTTEGEFTFHDASGRDVGTIRANMVEGRAFRSAVAGAPMPVFRFGGFGPILGGTGAFGGVSGMMSMNSVISVSPRTLSNLYVLRLVTEPGQSPAPPFAV